MTRLLALLLQAIGGAYLLVYVAVAVQRMPYPYELEWLEGAVVDHVLRVLAHRPLYVEPSLDFVPFIYTPLYFYVSAAVSWLMAPGFLPLRLVSFVASLGVLALIFACVRRETGRTLAGAFAALLFVATYRASGAWLDIARADSLFLLALFGALYLLRFRPGRASYVAAGLLLALSFLTKQTAAVVSLPLLLYALAFQRRHGPWFVASFVASAGLSIAALDALHDGWFRFYVFELPAWQGRLPERLLSFWTRDLLWVLGAAMAGGLLWLWPGFAPAGRAERGFWGLAALGLLAGSYLPRLYDGAYENVLIPAYAGIATLAGLGLDAALRRSRSDRAGAAVCAVAILQLLRLAYDPLAQLPTARDRAAGDRLARAVASVEGEVFVPYHGYLAASQGKPAHAHYMALIDVFKIEDEAYAPLQEGLRREVATAFRSRRFGGVVLDQGGWLLRLARPDYAPERRLFEDDRVFWPVTGLRTRPEVLYLPREAAGSRP